MESDSNLEDLPYDQFRSARSSGKRKPLLRLVLLLGLVVVVGGAAFAFLSGLVPMPGLAEALPPVVLANDATPTGEAPALAPTPAETSSPTDPTAMPEPPQGEAEAAASPTEAPAPSASRITPPDFSQVIFNRASADGEWADKAAQLAVEMAIAEPYDWEYLEFEDGTLAQQARAYYVGLLNGEMGYRMTFDDTFKGGITVWKFKLEGRRVTIQFWQGGPNETPHALVFTEGW